MAEPFSISRSRHASADPTLLPEIRKRTGSDAATSGIMRSIERFAADPTVIRYDVSPRSSSRFGGPAGPVSWAVRAVR